MHTYQLFLRDRCGVVAARGNIKARRLEDAHDIASVLCDACSDKVAYYELWDGQSPVPAAGLPVSPPAATKLDQRAQLFVLERMITWHGSRKRLGKSKRLVERIDAWSRDLSRSGAPEHGNL